MRIMNAKLLPFCFSLFFCLTAASVYAAPFVSPHGYSLSVPAGWHVKSPSMPGDDADIVVNRQVAVGDKMTTPMLQVQFRPINDTVITPSLVDLNQAILAGVRLSFPNLKVLSQTNSTLDGVRAIDCVFIGTTNGVPLRFHEVLVVKNKKAFTFTVLCPSQVYPRYAAAYAQMLSSIHWKS
jgi:hypothetical protein